MLLFRVSLVSLSLSLRWDWMSQRALPGPQKRVLMEGDTTPCVSPKTHTSNTCVFILQRGNVVSAHTDTTRWLTQTSAATLWLYGCVYISAQLCVCVWSCFWVLVWTTAAYAQTGGCQQHTNKLSGENQSGVWNDLGLGNKQQQVINQNWLKWRAGMRFSVLLGCLFVTREKLCCLRALRQRSRHADVMLQ